MDAYEEGAITCLEEIIHTIKESPEYPNTKMSTEEFVQFLELMIQKTKKE